MTNYRLLSDFSINIMSEAADNINLWMMSIFIVLSRYAFSTLSSAENIEYSFLNEDYWLSFKSIA